MITKKNSLIFILLILLIVGCVFSVNKYYDRSIEFEFYSKQLEKNSLIPSNITLDKYLIYDYRDK